MTEAARLLELDRVLELCAREASSELGRQRVLDSQPWTDLETVRAELAQVEEMVKLLSQSSLPIHGLVDISASLKRVALPGALLDRLDYLPIKDVLTVAGAIKAFFSHTKEQYLRLKSLALKLGDFAALIASFDRLFDSAGEVRDDASPALKAIRRQREAESRRLHQVLNSVLNTWATQKLTQEEAPAYREGRLLIPVKAEHRGHIKGIVQDESASGATVFVEPLEAIPIGNAIRRLEGDEIREIHRLLLELCDQIRSRLSDILAALDVLGQLDHLYARARFSRKLNCTVPEISDQPQLRLVDARHPLLALREGASVVPLTLTLGEETGGLLVITGPNAGGKTVALKTVGLMCLMAACGLHVSAAEGTIIPLLASLHCDIGDPQSLEQDLSTFTSHLKRLKEALTDKGKPKLVLLDEIGASTDPAEGSALARAALLELARQGALAVVTTHQGTLKVFAHETPGIINGSMEFDQETLRPTFRFRSGLPGSSYALEISARVGLPEEILKTAKRFLGEEQNRLEDLITRLNESLRLSETVRREAEVKRIEMESLRKLYGEKLRELTKSEKARLRQAAEEAKAILDTVNKRIEAEVKSIRERQADRGSILQAKHTIQEEKGKIQAILQETEKAEAKDESGEVGQPAFQVGDWVKLEGLKDSVRILALKKEGQEAMLEVGGVHLWMETSRLTPTSPTPGAEAVISVALGTAPASSYEIDLRGMTGDEAAFTVEKYLADCAVSGWKSVRIIHGKGTGALRTRVRQVLEKFPGVKSFRYGRPEEGEFGVTVVELE